MRLLLDSHTLLWWIYDVARLNPQAHNCIRDPDNEAFVSAASIWEIAIKKNQGKLRAPENMRKIVNEKGFMDLPVSLLHAETAGALPLHHRDPFDRMLVAQAQIEDLTLITNDRRIPRYEVRVIKAGE